MGGMREIVDAAGVGFTFNPFDAASVRAAMQNVHNAFQNGSLNRFDITGFASGRTEEAHLESLLQAYQGT
jgi:hypothetical protein